MQALAACLESRGIRYAIFGAQAARRYGLSRPTPDIDVLLGLEPSERLVLRALLDDLGWHVRWWRLTLLNPRTHQGRVPGVLVYDPVNGVKVDILLTFMPYDRQALERAPHLPHGRIPVRFASLDDVVVTKVLAGRRQDMKDAQELLMKHRDVDRAYIKHWLGRLGQDLSAPLLERWRRIEPNGRSLP